MNDRPPTGQAPADAPKEPSIFDLPGRPAKIECARVIVQLDLGLAHKPGAGHRHVIREARRRHDSLLEHARMAERSMNRIREEFGAFPKPHKLDDEATEAADREGGTAPSGFGM